MDNPELFQKMQFVITGDRLTPYSPPDWDPLIEEDVLVTTVQFVTTGFDCWLLSTYMAAPETPLVKSRVVFPKNTEFVTVSWEVSRHIPPPTARPKAPLLFVSTALLRKMQRSTVKTL